MEIKILIYIGTNPKEKNNSGRGGVRWNEILVSAEKKNLDMEMAIEYTKLWEFAEDWGLALRLDGF